MWSAEGSLISSAISWLISGGSMLNMYAVMCHSTNLADVQDTMMPEVYPGLHSAISGLKTRRDQWIELGNEGYSVVFNSRYPTMFEVYKNGALWYEYKVCRLVVQLEG